MDYNTDKNTNQSLKNAKKPSFVEHNKPNKVLIDEEEKQLSRSHYCHWNESQQRCYVRFLIERRRLFDQSIGKRKRSRIHSKMSNCIRSRNSNQCRSHHQKMLMKYGSIDAIVKEYQHLVGDLLNKSGIQSEPESESAKVKQQNVSEDIIEQNQVKEEQIYTLKHEVFSEIHEREESGIVKKEENQNCGYQNVPKVYFPFIENYPYYPFMF